MLICYVSGYKCELPFAVMSTVSKITLGASITFTIGIISYVHVWQTKEKERLRRGVLLDLERQQRKLDNMNELEQQAKLTEILRREESFLIQSDENSNTNSH